jgi:hypothetical protein
VRITYTAFRIYFFQSKMAPFFARLERAKKPGYPLQVLGFANANPAGFPLLSLARAQRAAKLRTQFCGRSICA